MRFQLDCQLAIVPWGTKARYFLARVGLVREGTRVYIAVFRRESQDKFPVKSGSIELLPAAIRLLDIQSDLFARKFSDEKLYTEMLRGIRVLLRKDELRRNGKGNKLERFIATIPQISSLKQSDCQPMIRVRRANLSLPDSHQATATDGLDPAIIGLSENELMLYNEWQKYQIQILSNTQVECIKLSNLRELPDQLWLTSSLCELYIVDCNLSLIPKQLEKLAPTLEYLDLSRNEIKNLPRTFCCKMSRLSYLNLSSNMIETLPLEIKFLQRLHEFDISNNCLKMIPTTLSDLHSLKVLKVSSNKLSQLPAFRRDDIRLFMLDISNNPFDGAQRHFSTSEVFSSYNDEYDPYTLSFMSSPLITPSSNVKNKVSSLFEMSILNIVRSDDLFKQASEEPLPKTIVSTIQRDIFKCHGCKKMNILPAYNSTDTLDYLEQVQNLVTSCNFCSNMTFMKLLCRSCFDYMAS